MVMEYKDWVVPERLVLRDGQGKVDNERMDLR